jgi:hypothetical protein
MYRAPAAIPQPGVCPDAFSFGLIDQLEDAVDGAALLSGRGGPHLKPELQQLPGSWESALS